MSQLLTFNNLRTSRGEPLILLIPNDVRLNNLSQVTTDAQTAVKEIKTLCLN